MKKTNIISKISVFCLFGIAGIIMIGFSLSAFIMTWVPVFFIVSFVISLLSILAIVLQKKFRVIKVKLAVLDWLSFIGLSFMGLTLFFGYVIVPSDINQSSMAPTFQDGDRVLVYHLAYQPKLNHVVVIDVNQEHYQVGRPTDDDKLYYVKRIAAQPGDELAFVQESVQSHYQIYINGKPYTNPFGDKYFIPAAKIPKLNQQLDGQKIPSNRYLVLGDNQSNSVDSRDLGLIYKEDILGHVFFKISPFGRVAS